MVLGTTSHVVGHVLLDADFLELINAQVLVNADICTCLTLVAPANTLANKHDVIDVFGSNLEITLKCLNNTVVKLFVSSHEQVVNMQTKNANNNLTMRWTTIDRV